jgi:hypothetical protein
LEARRVVGVRRSAAADPTGTNLLGWVKHLSIVEAWYLGKTFDRPFAEDLPWWDEGAEEQMDMWAAATETRAEIVGR